MGQLSEVNTSALGLVSEVKSDPVEDFAIKGSFLLSVQAREIRFYIIQRKLARWPVGEDSLNKLTKFHMLVNGIQQSQGLILHMGKNPLTEQTGIFAREP